MLPNLACGKPDASRVASSMSRASISTKPARCSLVSANGPCGGRHPVVAHAQGDRTLDRLQRPGARCSGRCRAIAWSCARFSRSNARLLRLRHTVDDVGLVIHQAQKLHGVASSRVECISPGSRAQRRQFDIAAKKFAPAEKSAAACRNPVSPIDCMSSKAVIPGGRSAIGRGEQRARIKGATTMHVLEVALFAQFDAFDPKRRAAGRTDAGAMAAPTPQPHCDCRACGASRSGSR